MSPRTHTTYQALPTFSNEDIILQPMIVTRQNVVRQHHQTLVPALAPEYRLIEQDFLTIERLTYCLMK